MFVEILSVSELKPRGVYKNDVLELIQDGLPKHDNIHEEMRSMHTE